jgi:hypothetical protein
MFFGTMSAAEEGPESSGIRQVRQDDFLSFEWMSMKTTLCFPDIE